MAILLFLAYALMTQQQKLVFTSNSNLKVKMNTLKLIQKINGVTN